MSIKANSEVINQVRKFLDNKSISYIHIAYNKKESELSVEDIESVLIEITNDDKSIQIAMIIVPAIRKINLESLQKVLNKKKISFIGKQALKLFPNYEIGTLPPFSEFHPNMPIYLTDEVLQLQKVTFHIQSYVDSFCMTLNDFLVTVGSVTNISVETVAKYRIEIAQVFPTTKRHNLHDYSHCIMGISLENPSFMSVKMVAMAEWVSKNFSECTVIIADSIHRFTLEINGTPTQDTLNQALAMGQKAMNKTLAVFSRLQQQCKFNFVLCSTLQKEQAYISHYNYLLNLLENDSNFKNSINSSASIFINHHTSGNPDLFNYHIELSRNYLLEELACAAIIVKKEGSVSIYPGALTISQELSEGLFPNAPAELKNIINVNIRPKKR